MKPGDGSRTFRKLAASFLILAAAGVFFVRHPIGAISGPNSALQLRRSPRLVSIRPLPSLDGLQCPWLPAGSGGGITLASLQQAIERPSGPSNPAGASLASRELDLEPVRTLEDEYATYSAVAVDPVRNEIAIQDENLFQILIFDRLANTPASATMTEPKRILSGPATKIEFNCGLYIDPKNGDLYSVNNDTTDTTVIFEHGLQGNVPPSRELHTPHGTYGIAVDEINGEMFFSIEHDNAVVAFEKLASGEDQPLRLIQGDHTGLGDPHGIAVDAENNWLFVANHGSTHRVRPDPQRPPRPNWPLTRSFAVPGSGRSEPPSITVYERTAQGDAAPLRTIQGPRTQLNWPAQISLDPERSELFVANDGGNSVLVFRTTDDGDAAPTRVIAGPQTGLLNPTGVWVDTVHDEVVVSSMGNHSAMVFPRTASGDVAPLRTIRSAPLGKRALAIGNPGAVAYDSKRDELLVPN